MRGLISSAAACVVLAAAAGESQAGFVTVSFTAHVTDVSPIPVPGLTAGLNDVVTGQFTFDLAAIDNDPSPDIGDYASGSSSLTIGGATLSSPGPAVQLVTSDLFIVTDVLNGDDFLTLQFVKLAGPANDHLPTAAEFNTFIPLSFQISHASGGFIAFDDVTSISAEEVSSAPEPSSLALIGVGTILAGIGSIRRRRVAIA